MLVFESGRVCAVTYYVCYALLKTIKGEDPIVHHVRNPLIATPNMLRNVKK